MKKRMLHMRRLRPECVEEYKAHHRNVWPELEAVYRRAGITLISCFLNENTLVIYTEYDATNYPASRSWVAGNEIEQKWGSLMKPLADPAFTALEFEEVYRMESTV